MVNAPDISTKIPEFNDHSLVLYRMIEKQTTEIEDAEFSPFLLNIEENKDILVGKSVDEIVYATTVVNIRSKPRLDGEIIQKLNVGNSVTRTFTGYAWSKIATEQGEIAYIHNDYLTTEKPVSTITDTTATDIPVANKANTNGSYIGTFTAYHYCPCALCCDVETGITATGTIATPNRTIAVDPNIIPLGSMVVINGQTYIAEDTGGGIQGYKIDIFTASHQEALNRGVISVDVYYVQ